MVASLKLLSPRPRRDPAETPPRPCMQYLELVSLRSLRCLLLALYPTKTLHAVFGACLASLAFARRIVASLLALFALSGTTPFARR